MVSKPAQALLVLIGLALLAPTWAMGLQSVGSLEQFHNRVLTPWPKPRSFASDPARYFAQVNRWFADRAYPIIAATYGRNNLAYFALGASPAANITVGRGGLVFLNGDEAETENGLVEAACLEAGRPAGRAAFEAALARIALFGRRHGVPVDVVMFPTVPLLYGDRLPPSFPPALRAACAAGPAGQAPLSRVRAPEGLAYAYPFAELSALRDDPAMYPLGNFHPDGLSVETVTGSYLRAIGAAAPALAFRLSRGPSEVLAEQGVVAPFALYAVSGSGAAEDKGAMPAIQAAMAPFYSPSNRDGYLFRDAAAPNPQAVLVFSDSFGANQGISLAAAFRAVAKLPPPERDPAGTIDALRAAFPFDRIVLVFNDSNFGQVVAFADKLPAEP